MRPIINSLKRARNFAAVCDALLADDGWRRVQTTMAAVCAKDVAAVLAKKNWELADLPVLLSPAAADRLEALAQRAHALTLQRFGRVMLLYAPLYVSNYCTNLCAYCGFNARNPLERRALTVDEAVRESTLLHAQGFRHILLVSGQHPQHAQAGYLAALAERIRHAFSSIAVEVAPLRREEYATLVEHGVDGVTCYQETYNPATYRAVHLGGPKRDYDWRLGTLERAAQAGMRKVGLSALYGLDDWRVEAFFVGVHAHFLMAHYWQTQISISFPRLRAAAGGYQPPQPLSDAGLAQMICALRLVLPDAQLVLSTREPAALRDRLLPLGITQMSAGSRTAPQGYSQDGAAGEQFDVQDERTAADVAAMLTRAGYEPVWKDWDAVYLERAIA
jgi:2-iminoacetate synthase